MPMGFFPAIAGIVLLLFALAYLGKRQRKAASRHMLELEDLQKQLNELAGNRKPELAPVLKLAEKTMPLAELAEQNGRNENFWHHRAALRVCVAWARAILADDSCAEARYNNQVLFAVTFINKRNLDGALEVFSNLWLEPDAPKNVKITCLCARIEMLKVGGFYDEAARTEQVLDKLMSLGDGEQISYEIN